MPDRPDYQHISTILKGGFFFNRPQQALFLASSLPPSVRAPRGDTDSRVAQSFLQMHMCPPFLPIVSPAY